jgi:Na+/phosphate symporter
MVLSFAGAGILSLAGAIGVIIGANVGGTFLAVIIAKL